MNKDYERKEMLDELKLRIYQLGHILNKLQDSNTDEIEKVGLKCEFTNGIHVIKYIWSIYRNA